MGPVLLAPVFYCIYLANTMPDPKVSYAIIVLFVLWVEAVSY